MRKCICAILTIFIAVLCNAQNAKNLKVQGEVVCAKTALLSFPKNGVVSYVAPFGTFVKSPLVDADGRIIRQGDLLASLDTTYYKMALKEAELKVEMSKTAFNQMKKDYERALQLSKGNAISEKDLLNAETLCKNAEYELLKDSQDLAMAALDLDSCNIYAPFSGMVEEVFFRAGVGVPQGTNVVKLSMISPVIIRIKLPQEAMDGVSLRDKISIYPVGSDQPSGGWFDRRYAFSDHIDLFARNEPKAIPKLSEKQDKMAKVRQIQIVFATEIEKGKISLTIPPAALNKDDEGNFVFRAKDQVFPTPLPLEFTVEKVRVKPMDAFVHSTTYDHVVLADPGSLKVNQFIVTIAETPLKDNETVVFQELDWQFKEGQQVNVEIIKTEH